MANEQKSTLPAGTGAATLATAVNNTKIAEKIAEIGKPAPAAEPEPTSEKLTEIRGKMDALLATDQSKFSRDEKLKINLEIFGLTNDEKTEIANIKKAAADLKAQEARNAKIKTIDDLIAAAIDNNAAIGDKKLSIEDKNAKNDLFHKLRENVVNAVLGSRPATTTASGDKPAPTGTKGATGAEIVALYDQYRAEGKTDKEARDLIKAAGHSRGTTDAVILAAKGSAEQRK